MSYNLIFRDMKVNGSIIRCREEEFTLGRTVENTKVSIIKIRSMAMGFTNGPMEEVGNIKICILSL